MILLTVFLFAGVQAASDNPDGAPGPKMICRRIEITGSIMGARRLCKTKDDWRRFDDGNHEKAVSLRDPTKHGWGEER